VKHRRLGVSINSGEFRGEIFTDVSLEKGADSNCIRYTVNVRGKRLEFTDAAVSNGIVITTAAGSTGYFSYLDKLARGDKLEPERFTVIGQAEVGVCHIAPTYTSREGTVKHPLRYTVPWGATFKISLMRDADAHLFGVTRSRKGLRVTTKDNVEVGPSNNTTNAFSLPPARHATRFALLALQLFACEYSDHPRFLLDLAHQLLHLRYLDRARRLHEYPLARSEVHPRRYGLFVRHSQRRPLGVPDGREGLLPRGGVAYVYRGCDGLRLDGDDGVAAALERFDYGLGACRLHGDVGT
jgi:hypothetical protein